jgi:hypothetical protein
MPSAPDLPKPPPFILIADDESDMVELLTLLMQGSEEKVEIAGAQCGEEGELIEWQAGPAYSRYHDAGDERH